MKAARLFVTLVFVAMLGSIYSPSARADEWDKKTVVTFSGPVDVSGHRLEAGTYVFKLADSQSDRHIVQIFNEDESHIIATILAIPDWRVTPRSKTVIKFSERAGNASTITRELPESGIPVKEWFYPGDNFGQEFIVKPAPVMAESSTSTETVAVAQPAATPEPEAKEEHEVKSAEAEVEPTPAPVEVAQAAPAPAAAPAEMPRTASSMPLIALLGFASLGAGLSLRAISKNMA